MIIAVDFDGTLAVTNYPDIIEPIHPVIDFCIRKKNAGDTIILWTCRRGNALIDAVKWCEEQGLVFDYINKNSSEIVREFGDDCRKIFANIYIDDRAISAQDIIDMEGGNTAHD